MEGGRDFIAGLGCLEPLGSMSNVNNLGFSTSKSVKSRNIWSSIHSVSLFFPKIFTHS